ncbi:MAG: hypothetical protein AAF715_17705, partial [Myxococcota bacterium]
STTTVDGVAMLADKSARASIAPQGRFYCLGGALLFGPVKSTDLTGTITSIFPRRVATLAGASLERHHPVAEM